jgi:hypothetical protein
LVESNQALSSQLQCLEKDWDGHFSAIQEHTTKTSKISSELSQQSDLSRVLKSRLMEHDQLLFNMNKKLQTALEKADSSST